MQTEIEFSEEALKNATPEVLAAYVVLYRGLGISKELAIKCMQELSTRRANGNDFDFEAYIESELQKLPKPKNTDYGQIFNAISSNMKSFSQVTKTLKSRIPENKK